MSLNLIYTLMRGIYIQRNLFSFISQRVGLILLLCSIGNTALGQSFADFTFLAIPTGQAVLESGAVWGDMDNDGDLDLVVAGEVSFGNPQTILYRNTGGILAEDGAISATFVNVWKAGIAWGDYNNDGFLDIIICGQTQGGAPVSKLYTNNGGASFTENTTASNTFVDVFGASAEWADYDNDGDQDILIIGESTNGETTKMYRNDGGVFAEDIAISNLMEDVEFGDIAFADYDNDGHLDVAIQGLTVPSQPGTPIVEPFTGIYHNTGLGGFEFVTTGISFVQEGSLEWADYDNDGFLDLLISGIKKEVGPTSTDIITKLYHNNGGGSFTDINAPITDIQKGRATWGDYDNDGWPDILVVGQSDTSTVAHIFHNDGGTFSIDIINSTALTPMDQGATVLWGDYNGDKKLDILTIGRTDTLTYAREIHLYQNIDLNPNTTPGAPQNLAAVQVFDEVHLSWDPPAGYTGAQANSLTYNIYIGTTPLAIDIKPPMSDLFESPKRIRRVVQMGNVTGDETWQVRNLPGGTYYWNVQAVDADYEAGPWFTEETFVYVPPVPTFEDVSGTSFPGGFPGRINGDADWGDYDNDGDLDLVVSGEVAAFNYETTIYKNNNGVFVEDGASSAPLVDVTLSTVAWGDYDNDGDLDLLVCGQDASANSHSNIYQNNGAGLLTLATDASSSLQDVLGASAAWGDYNNDGFLDIVICGELGNIPYTKIYQNNGNGTFTEDLVAENNITDLSFGEVAWGDYDNDEDLDLAIIGKTTSGVFSDVYENDNGVFTSINAPLIDVKEGSIDWGDYNNDGFLDLLLTGEAGNGAPESKVYQNNQTGGFFDTGIDIKELENGQAAWGDYDNDGFLDILIAGEEGNGDPSTRLYLNQAGGGFVEDFDNVGFVTEAELNASVIWGDYNNDGRIDFFITGQGPAGKIFKLYENIDTSPFTIQTLNAPTGLVATQVGDNIELGWDVPPGIPPALEEAISYNIYVSQTPPGPIGNASPVNPMAEVDGGFRKVVRHGNTSLNTSWYIQDLEGGTYYWSVQAILGDFRSTPFANQQIFSFSAPDFVDVSSGSLPAATLAEGLDEADISWADYDQDGDLDILVTGNTASGFSSELYRNNNGNFLLDAFNSGIIADVWKGAAAWGDYDNDGWIDLMLTGESSAGVLSKLYHNDGTGIFSESAEVFTFVQDGSVAWGDYDNDGDLDLALSGESGSGPITKLYRNEGNSTFLDTGLPFTNVQASSLAWGDYNNDGWVDLLLGGDTGTERITKLYQNNSDGTFSEIPTSLADIDDGSLAWGDYNHDGFLDILLTGNTDTGPVSNVYFNNLGTGTFNGIGAGLTPIKNGKAVWGDYNNDQFLDILLIGEGVGGIGDLVVELFQNNGGFAFAKDEINSSAFIAAGQGSMAVWGDYNNDGKLDVLLAGRSDNSPITRALKIYENQGGSVNNTPTEPQNLSMVQVDDHVILSWDPPAGYTGTQAAELTYEVCVGNTVGGVEVASPMTNLANGHRYIVRPGRTHRTTWTLENLPIGSYFWSVQAIDAAFEGSPFAAKETFNFVPPGAAFINTTTAHFPIPPSGVEAADISWADYDHDNDLDLLVLGKDLLGNSMTALYENTSGGFVQDLPASVGFSQLSNGDAAWGDLNHDGLIDLVLVGTTSGGGATSILYLNNGNGSFAAQAFTPIGVQNSSVALGDYDNDGDLDIFMSGLSAGGLVSVLFDNDGQANFVDSGIEFQSLSDGDAAWGDYNNDGFLDLLLIGNNGVGPVSKLYQNTGNSGFLDQPIGIIPVSKGSVDWGDYDNDGDLDILMTGASSTEPVSKVYKNEGVGGFNEDPGAVLIGVQEGRAAWGDYDDDGLLDIVLIGTPTPVVDAGRIAKIYHNNNGTFFGEDPLNSSIITAANGGSSLAWADYDKDGKLDLAVVGKTGNVPNEVEVSLFQNINANPNTTPTSPTNLLATQDGNDIILSWDPPTIYPDALKDGLSYNLYLGTTFGSIDVVSPNTDLGSGFYQVVREGGIKGTSWRIKNLAIGTYFWNVQAIDADYEASPFAQPGATFTFIPPGAAFIDVTNDTTFSVSLPEGLINADLAWGDYDNDGDLDLLAAGENTIGTFTTDIYRNDAGIFQRDVLASTPLIGISEGAVAWGDYDNDGFIDILLAGTIATGSGRTSVVYRNTGGGTFADIGANLTALGKASVAWGDYDNDGDLDILLSGEQNAGGTAVTKVFQNDDGNFVDAFISLVNVKDGQVAWGDYDGDHRLDILITGQTTGGAMSKVYQNQGGGTFLDIGAPIVGLQKSAATWGDYNNDGFLDIAISGEDPSLPTASNAITKLYQYNSATNNFVDANISLTGLKAGDIAWGDFNNDGYMDLVLSGQSGPSTTARQTLLYRNQNGNTFVEDDINSVILTNVDEGSAFAWGDYDLDGKLDLAIAGKSGNANGVQSLKLFRNIDANSNNTPGAPQITANAQQNGEEVTISWQAPAGYSAALEAGLSYNVYISTLPAEVDTKSPMANISNGYRRVVQIGNTAHSTSWTVTGLTAGKYYWSVQTIDQDFEGSVFAPENSFTYIPPGAAFIDVTATTFSTIPIGLSDGAMEWGDYDNDDELDILVAGKHSDGTLQTAIYQNNNGIYSLNNVASGVLEDVGDASVSWTDYNNDGWLDILITGNNGTANVTKLYRNDGGNFVEVDMGFAQVTKGAAKWGDYDNDGDSDLLLIGESATLGPISKIYRNENGNAFTDINAGLTNVYDGSIAWGDYDADGDLDILLTGELAGGGPNSQIYRNDAGVFTDAGANLLNVSMSSVSWADFNNDGYLDILLTGEDTPVAGSRSAVRVYYYRPATQNFEAINVFLTAVRDGSAVCGDYNDDGWIDIILSGKVGVTQRTTRIYTNIGGSGFAEDLVNSSILTDLDVGSSVVWGDYNKDGKLDLLMSGRSSSTPIANTLVLYENIDLNNNLTAIAPNTLVAQQVGTDALFSWQPPSNYNASLSSGLSYNLYLGTTVAGVENISPLANINNGFRRIVRMGDIKTTSVTIKNLAAANYYWSVQAIEADYEGSPFANVQRLNFQAPDFINVSSSTLPTLPAGLKDTDMAWADYDLDGDLDVVVTGDINGDTNGGAFTKLYKQDGGVFSDAGISLINVKNGSVDWGDANNDGYPDLLITGEPSFGLITRILINDQQGGFSDTQSGLDGISDGDAKWFDFDQDGLQDIIFSGLSVGGRTTQLIKNYGLGAFAPVSINIPGFSEASIAIGDYDKDGDGDILIAGQIAAGTQNARTFIYRNDGNGVFVEAGISLTGVSNGNVAWGDYNNDSYPDLLLSGNTAVGPAVQVYENDQNGGFTQVSTRIFGIQNGTAIWGDYDNDGDLDILITGNTSSNNTGRYTSLYKNIGGDFEEDDLNGPILSNANQGSSAAWADYDRDGKLDVILAGSTEDAPNGTLMLFRNNVANPNVTPPPPTGLQNEQAGQTINLSWSPPQNFDPGRLGALCYNVYIGTLPQQGDSYAGLSDESNGFRQVVKWGNATQTRKLSIEGLAPGTYYWSVQAIDTDYEGSPFAEEDTFTVLAPTFVDVSSTTFPIGLPAGLSLSDLDWGDYDADGDLDLLAIGQSASSNTYTALFVNDQGNLIENANFLGPLGNVRNGSVDWGDFDNDGDLDILMTGEGLIPNTTSIFENTGNGFVQFSAPLEAVRGGKAVWGDYDNDGLLDILLIGETSTSLPVSRVYKNLILNGINTFVASGITLQDIKNGDATWGDFNRDGYLDILLSGEDISGQKVTQMYENDGAGGFNPLSTSLLPASESAIAWGDFNNDGFPDILLSGEGNTGLFTKVYLNNGDESFTDIQANLQGAKDGSVAWGDFNDDGFQDILLTGKIDPNDEDRITALYQNVNGASFALDVINSPVLSDVDLGSIAIWGDYDKDNKIDILLAGRSQANPMERVFKLFRNTDPAPNRVISPPILRPATQLGDKMRLIWDPPVGEDSDLINGVSYNLFVGTSRDAFNQVSPMSDISNGYRRIVSMGNAHQSLQWDISGLEAGKYFWSVQSIDVDHEGSEFAPVDSFIYIPPGAVFIDETGGGFPTGVVGLYESSLAWGDYDNDRDLDVLVSGRTSANTYATILFNNNNGVFSPDLNAVIANVGNSDAKWSDYDNDGDLDILIIGENENGSLTKIYRNEGNSQFIDIGLLIDPVKDGSVNWADFNNDGLQDFVITGTNSRGAPLSLLFRNNGIGSFDLVQNVSFKEVSASSSLWIDYDKDGDQDLMLAGLHNGDPLSILYRNDGNGNFTESGISFIGLYNGSLTWGDYDNNGYPDILMTGYTGFNPETRIYRNNGDGTFLALELALENVYQGQAMFGDYDDDGWPDIIISGKHGINADSRISVVYHNDQGSFSQDDINTAILEDMDAGSSIAWGDFNNDGKLDVLMAGRTTDQLNGTLRLYRNIDSNPNIPAAAPGNLIPSQQGDEITFTWEPPSDYGADIVNGLSYNLYVGSTSLGVDKVSPMSDVLNGKRKVVFAGNVGQRTSWTLKGLNAGNYFWNVQSVEADYEGSPFAIPEQNFDYIPPDFSEPPISQVFTDPDVVPSGLIDGDIAWADYSGDGMLDFIITGKMANDELYIAGYESFVAPGSFLPSFGIVSNVLPVSKGDMAWGDFNNDNSPDLIVTGESSNGLEARLYFKQNSAADFLEALNVQAFVPIMESSVAWGDYNNDGWQDIIMAGKTAQGDLITNLYRNTGLNDFELVNTNIVGIHKGDLAWGDYDNDRDLDLLLTGISENGPITRIYENDGQGGFREVNIALQNLGESSAAWGDMDNDGRLDILIAGNNGIQNQTMVFKNNGAQGFRNFGGQFTGVKGGNVSWGDFDDDGFLDILLTGTSNSNTPITQLYKNFGGATILPSTINSVFLENVHGGGQAKWGDFNDDGKLDFALIGATENGSGLFRLYQNDNGQPNLVANAPRNLEARQIGEAIEFSWQPPEGYDANLSKGLSYNLYIGTTSRFPNLQSPLSSIPFGVRKVVKLGVVNDTSWVVKNLPDGEYYWSVQAIEADYEGSEFATEDFINFLPPTFSDVTTDYFDFPLNLADASMDWGDYDNDGDFDLLIIGDTAVGQRVTLVCQLGENGYEIVPNLGLRALEDGDVSWGDFNHDGLLDFIITGLSAAGPYTRIYRGTGIFSSPFVGFSDVDEIVNVSHSSVDWGDYDNDGDLDLLITGLAENGPTSRIYQNTEGSFFDIQAGLTGISSGDAKWGDYDNDGLLDLVLSGDANGTRISELYHNDGENFFTPIDVGLIPLRESSIDWGDCDNDGLIDLLISGDSENGPQTLVYKNLDNNTFFIDPFSALRGIRDGSVNWGDYNNDGFRDIIITGKDGPNVLDRTTRLYRGNGAFFIQDTVNTDFVVDVNQGSKAIWGDFNNDLKLDFMISGRAANNPNRNIFRLYQNIGNIPTIPPQKPKELAVNVDSDRVTLTWTLPTGYDPNVIGGLSYNVYIEKAPEGTKDFQLSPMSLYENGKRKVVRVGNTGNKSSYTVFGLEGGDYFFGVQTIEANYNASEFSTLGAFTFVEPTFSDQTSGSLPTLPFRGLDNASIDWGDFDNDNDLDVIITGEDETGPQTRLLVNEHGVLQPSPVDFIDVMNGCAKWGDYDNDGFLDIFITGETGAALPVMKLYRNVGGNSFIDLGGFLEGASDSYADWGDFDNDGDPDLLVIGQFSGQPGGAITRIYQNNSVDGQLDFDIFAASLVNLKDGMVDWGDYDNDGDLDILITGHTGSIPITDIYRSDPPANETDPIVVFTRVGDQLGLTGVSKGSAQWGDFNNDAKLDFVISGYNNNDQPVLQIYKNEGDDKFVPFNVPITAVTEGMVAWGDYNDDGYKDLAVVGQAGSSDDSRVSRIYRNIEGTTFSHDELASVFLQGVENGAAVAWADYDNDQKLDLMLAGRSRANRRALRLYHNNEATPNRVPEPPENLDASISFSATGAKFQWEPPANYPDSLVGGLSYNIYVWKEDLGDYSAAPAADTTSGYRKLVHVGNVGHGNQWTIELREEGNYLWSVQSIDTDFEGSAFADERPFFYKPEGFVDITPTLFPGGVEGVNSSTLIWGDYDNDGDLDILAAGEVTEDTFSTAIYRNDFNPNTRLTTFEKDLTASDPLINVRYASLDWGDYDWDGDLDILLCGQDTSGNRISRIYRNEPEGNGRTFVWDTLASQNLEPVWGASSAWGDYDNDGDLDIMITGNAASGPVTILYESLHGRLFVQDTTFTGVEFGSMAWGDFDRDNYLDMIISGLNAGGAPFTQVFRNDGDGGFIDFDLSAPIVKVKESSVAWGDCNNDGFLDLIITGDRGGGGSGSVVTEIYKYDPIGGKFDVLPEPDPGNPVIKSVKQGSVDWGDFDSDGDLDIIITGRVNDTTRISKVYINNFTPNQTVQFPFTEDINTSGKLEDVDLGASVWGDYDADGKLDILLSGRTAEQPVERTFAVYRNIDIDISTAKPGVPENLTVDNSQRDRLVFNWQPPSSYPDSLKEGLTYNVMVLAYDSARFQMTPMADTISGYRRIVKIGNAGHSTSYELRGLPTGTYCWSVQTVDPDFQGSNFAPYESCFEYESPTPQIIDSLFAKLFIKDSDTIQSWIRVRDPSIVERVDFWYRGIAQYEPEFHKVTAVHVGDTFKFRFSNPFVIENPSAVNDEGDEIGLEYYFQVVGKFNFNAQTPNIHMYIHYPDGLDITRNNASYIMKYGKEADSYGIMSIPLNLEDNAIANVVEDDLGPYDIYKWRFWHYLAGGLQDGKNIEYKSGLDTLGTGNGYWIIMGTEEETNDSINTTAGTTVQVKRDLPYKIRMKPGWNQIGNPYHFDVIWEDIPQIVDSNLQYCTYDRRFIIDPEQLRKFEGGFVFAPQEMDLEIPAVKNPAVRRTAPYRGPVSTSIDALNWKVDLVLQANEHLYTMGGIGMNLVADTSFDTHDIMRPPRPAQYLDITSWHDDYELWPMFSGDIVPTTENHIWDFEVANNINSEFVDILWNKEGIETDDQRLYIYHIERERYLDMQEVEQYRFYNDGKTHHFRIFFGNQDFIDEHLIPSNITLGHAYPNPFSDEVRIPFSLPEGVNKGISFVYKVALKIYNPMGQEVQTLFEGALKPDFYEMSWDGRNKAGTKVAEGIYIYQLIVDTPSGPFRASKRVMRR